MMFTDFLKYYLEDVLKPTCAPATAVVYSYVLYKNVMPIMEKDVEIGLVNKDILDKILEKVDANGNIVVESKTCTHGIVKDIFESTGIFNGVINACNRDGGLVVYFFTDFSITGVAPFA